MKVITQKNLEARLGLAESNAGGLPEPGYGVQWSRYLGEGTETIIANVERFSEGMVVFILKGSLNFFATIKDGNVLFHDEAAMDFETFEGELSRLDIELPFYEL